MGSSKESVMGYSTVLSLLALVTLLFKPTACECECNGIGAGVDGVHAPCEAQWGEGVVGYPDKRRFCFVDEGVCPDQKKTSKNRFWSHLACYDSIPGKCPAGHLCFVGNTLVRRYGGGGSGSWRRPRRKGARWRLSITRQSNREKYIMSG